MEAFEGNEKAEGRGRPEGNPLQKAKVRTQRRAALPPNLQRVNEAARRNKRTRFTALLHHVDQAALLRAFRRLKRSASAGIDGETVASYERNLQESLQQAHDARRLLADLRELLAQFRMTLHEEKTRLLEFGRLPALERQRRGLRRLETFAFLDFTHYCGWSRDGRFVVKRKTEGRRLGRKLKSLAAEARVRMHAPVAEQHHWLCQVPRGHYAYYGLRSNTRSLKSFSHQVRRLWFRALRKRSQRRMSWDGFCRLLEAFWA